MFATSFATATFATSTAAAAGAASSTAAALSFAFRFSLSFQPFPIRDLRVFKACALFWWAFIRLGNTI
jgi:hypothetical protein